MSRPLATVTTLLVPVFALASEAKAEEGGTSFLTPLLPQIVWAVITFFVAFGILWKFAWPAIVQALDEREARIRDAIAAAETAQKEAQEARERTTQELAAERRRMDEEVAAMKAELGRAREGLLAAARQEAEAVQRKALEAIEQAKLQALAEVKTRAVDLAVAGAERIIARRLSGEDERRFAQEVIDSFVPPKAR